MLFPFYFILIVDFECDCSLYHQCPSHCQQDLNNSCIPKQQDIQPLPNSCNTKLCQPPSCYSQNGLCQEFTNCESLPRQQSLSLAKDYCELYKDCEANRKANNYEQWGVEYQDKTTWPCQFKQRLFSCLGLKQQDCQDSVWETSIQKGKCIWNGEKCLTYSNCFSLGKDDCKYNGDCIQVDDFCRDKVCEDYDVQDCDQQNYCEYIKEQCQFRRCQNSISEQDCERQEGYCIWENEECKECQKQLYEQLVGLILILYLYL